MRRTIFSLLLSIIALPAVALDGANASHLQHLLSDASKVPHVDTPAAMPVRDFGQTVWALTLSGEMAVARNLVEVGLNAVDKAEPSGRPRGSLPPTLRADGTSDDPRYLVDAQGVSAVLEAASRYVAALPEGERAAWLNKWWKQLEAAGSFVIRWTSGLRGNPFPAYDPRYARDVGGVRESMGALLGTICAQELAARAGKSVPETWQQRRDALEALVRTTDFSDGGRADASTPWGSQQLRGILPESHPLWVARVGTTSIREYAWGPPSADNPAQILISALARPASTP